MGIDVNGEIYYLGSTTDGCSPWRTEHSSLPTKKSNMVQIPTSLTIKDLRGREKSFDLDTNGFEVVEYNGSINKEFENGSEAQKTYYKEISELLKKRLGASHVCIFHHAFRFRNSSLSEEKLDLTHRNPAFYVHVDTDATTTHKLIDEKFGEEQGEKLKKNRIQFINVWRPIGLNPITNKPLTICDYRSIDINNDVRPFTIHGADKDTTLYTLTRNAQDAHIWYYMSQMRPNEMFLFKSYDSKPGVAQWAFHTAFENGNGSASKEEQLSLELRCLVFYDE